MFRCYSICALIDNAQPFGFFVGRRLRGVGGEAVHYFCEPFIEGGNCVEYVSNLGIQVVTEIGRQSRELVGQVCSDYGYFFTDHFGKVVLNVGQNLGLEVFGADRGGGHRCGGSGDIGCGSGVLSCIFILVSGGFGKFGVFGCVEVEGVVAVGALERGSIPLFLHFVDIGVVAWVLAAEFVGISI